METIKYTVKSYYEIKPNCYNYKNEFGLITTLTNNKEYLKREFESMKFSLGELHIIEKIIFETHQNLIKNWDKEEKANLVFTLKKMKAYKNNKLIYTFHQKNSGIVTPINRLRTGG